ncbi:hypothetical protein KEM56_001643 [Ascosphaera pollenicola]|nr:hypothetical protein KEM56_001643 [Ascosphaera pollenicola]
MSFYNAISSLVIPGWPIRFKRTPAAAAADTAAPDHPPEAVRPKSPLQHADTESGIFRRDAVKKAMDELDKISMQSGRQKRRNSGTCELWKIPGAFPRDPAYVSSDDAETNVSVLLPLIPAAASAGPPSEITASSVDWFPPLAPAKSIEVDVRVPETKRSETVRPVERPKQPQPVKSFAEVAQQHASKPARPIGQGQAPVQRAGNTAQAYKTRQEHAFPPLNPQMGASPSSAQNHLSINTASVSRWTEFAAQRAQAPISQRTQQRKQMPAHTKNTDTNLEITASSASNSERQGDQVSAIIAKEPRRAVNPITQNSAVAVVTSRPSLPLTQVNADGETPSSHAATGTISAIASTESCASEASRQPIPAQVASKPRMEARWIGNEDFTDRAFLHPLPPKPAGLKMPGFPGFTQNERTEQQPPQSSSPQMPLSTNSLSAVVGDKDNLNSNKDILTMNENRSLKGTLGETVIRPSNKDNGKARSTNDALVDKMIEGTKALQLSKWGPKQRQPPLYADHNIRYMPSKPSDDAYRTVAIYGLPDSVTLADVTSIVRGGCTLSVHIMRRLRTQQGKMTMAVVVFHEGKAAAAYVKHARERGIYVRSADPVNSWKRLSVLLLPVPTIPPTDDMDSDIWENGCTRRLLISRIPGSAQRDAMLKMLRTIYPWFFAKDGFGGGMAEVIIPDNEEGDEQLEEGEILEAGRSCEIHLHSIDAAMKVVKILAKLPGLRAEFLVDPCSGPVKELSQSKVYGQGRLYGVHFSA